MNVNAIRKWLTPLLLAAMSSACAMRPGTEWDTLNRRATELYEAGQYERAVPVAREALVVVEKTAGPNNLEVAASLNNLAAIYQAQGRYALAVPLLERMLPIQEKILGPEHPHVGRTLNNLASYYYAQQRYAQAEPLYERSLAIAEQDPEANRERVVASLNNLAKLHTAQGRRAQAAALYERLLAIQEEDFGADHPLLVASLNDLAESYFFQEDYARAEPLFRRMVAIQERELGVDHPDLATTLNNLATLYREQGQYTQAESLYERSMAIWKKALGPDHPQIAISLNNLGFLYDMQDRYAEAQRAYERSLALREAIFGPDHPLVATSLNNLASHYYHRELYAQAEPLLQRSLTILEASVGPDYPDVAMTRESLVTLYRAMGREPEAEKLERRALRATAPLEAVGGPSAPYVQAFVEGFLSGSDGAADAGEPLDDVDPSAVACFGRALVDAVGIETLDTAGVTPEAFGEAETLVAVGLAPDPSIVDELMHAVETCRLGPTIAVLVADPLDDEPLQDQTRDCVLDAVAAEPTVLRSVIEDFTFGESEERSASALGDHLLEVVLAGCPTYLSDLVVGSFESAFRSKGIDLTFSEAARACIEGRAAVFMESSPATEEAIGSFVGPVLANCPRMMTDMVASSLEHHGQPVSDAAWACLDREVAARAEPLAGAFVAGEDITSQVRLACATELSGD